MKHPRPKRASKPPLPLTYKMGTARVVWAHADENYSFTCDAWEQDAKDARRLAAWLIRFADWAEGRKP